MLSFRWNVNLKVGVVRFQLTPLVVVFLRHLVKLYFFFAIRVLLGAQVSLLESLCHGFLSLVRCGS
jgi:hypothetical protein